MATAIPPHSFYQQTSDFHQGLCWRHYYLRHCVQESHNVVIRLSLHAVSSGHGRRALLSRVTAHWINLTNLRHVLTAILYRVKYNMKLAWYLITIVFVSFVYSLITCGKCDVNILSIGIECSYNNRIWFRTLGVLHNAGLYLTTWHFKTW